MKTRISIIFAKSFLVRVFMYAKIIIILCLVAVITALGFSLYFMVKDGDKSLRTTKALTWRIFFTIILLIFIIFAYHQGWIHPNQTIQF